MIKIEVLFSEHCNLFGDTANIRYLQKTLPDAEFTFTKLVDEPKFVSEKYDLVYMGPMTENTQPKVIAKLLPYKAKIEELINEGTIFLFTGNATEVLGSYILEENGNKINGLGIFNFYAKRDMFHRHNSETLGTFSGMKIMGFRSQFTQAYIDGTANFEPFCHVEKGMGLNTESKEEGIKKNNFFGTYMLGPILINNPCFTEYLLKLIGSDNKPAFYESAQKAYDLRLKDFMDKVGDNVEKYHYM